MTPYKKILSRIPNFVLALGLRLGAALVLQGFLCWVVDPLFHLGTPTYLQALILLCTLDQVQFLLRISRGEAAQITLTKQEVVDGQVGYVLMSDYELRAKARDRILATYYELWVAGFITLFLAQATWILG